MLEFRGGGEVQAPKDLVAELLPDEVPYAKAFALEALAASPAAVGPRLSDVAVRELVDRVAARVGRRPAAGAARSCRSNRTGTAGPYRPRARWG